MWISTEAIRAFARLARRDGHEASNSAIGRDIAGGRQASQLKV
jgi:hypothetical protein